MLIDDRLTSLKNLALKIPVLGSYTRPNQSKVKAVWVGDEPPVNYIAEGIEAIVRISEVDYSKLMCENITLSFVCEVAFINHGSTFPKDFIEIYSPPFFKDCRQTETSYSPPTQKTLGELRLKLSY